MRIVAMDTETTGIDYERDEIVTASLVEVGDDGKFKVTEWLLKTNIDSSPEAYSKHLISREEQLEKGTDYDTGIEEICKELTEKVDYLVTANGAFDLSMLQGSFNRLTTEEYYDLSAIKMIDVMVLDKYLDKYRRGSRKLTDLAEHYGINYEGVPHNATFDSILTYAIFIKLRAVLESEGHPLETLPRLCETKYHEQKKDLAEYFDKIGRRATVTTGYPVNTGKIEVGI